MSLPFNISETKHVIKNLTTDIQLLRRFLSLSQKENVTLYITPCWEGTKPGKTVSRYKFLVDLNGEYNILVQLALRKHHVNLLLQ